MAGDAENKRGYRTIFRSISQVFYANAKNSSNTNNSHNNNTTNYNNNSGWSHNNNNDYSEGVGRLTVTLTSITPPTATWTSTSPTISTCTTASSASTASSSPLAGRAVRSAENISCSECGNPAPNQEPGINPTKLLARTPQTSHHDGMGNHPQPLAKTDQKQKLRASSMLDLTSNHPHQKMTPFAIGGANKKDKAPPAVWSARVPWVTGGRHRHSHRLLPSTSTSTATATEAATATATSVAYEADRHPRKFSAAS